MNVNKEIDDNFFNLTQNLKCTSNVCCNENELCLKDNKDFHYCVFDVQFES